MSRNMTFIAIKQGKAGSLEIPKYNSISRSYRIVFNIYFLGIGFANSFGKKGIRINVMTQHMASANLFVIITLIVVAFGVIKIVKKRFED